MCFVLVANCIVCCFKGFRVTLSVVSFQNWNINLQCLLNLLHWKGFISVRQDKLLLVVDYNEEAV